jgi:tetratricopeptide (TPR) repeat protein
MLGIRSLSYAFADPATILREADAGRDRQAWGAAVKAYQAYLRQKPEDGPIWVQLGNCQKEAGDLAGASEAYQSALRLMQGDADLHVQLGHLAKLRGRPDDAIVFYRRAVDLDRNRRDAWDELWKLDGGSYQRANDQRETDERALVNPARDRLQNLREAAADPDNVARSALAITAFKDRLPAPYPADEPGLIPQMLHFVFGFKEKGDIPYYGYLAIKSALHYNPGWRAFYYTMHEPVGPNWDRIAGDVTVVLIDDFDYFGNVRLHHYAHKADIIRMIILTETGGVYLDIDTITKKSFEPLRAHDFVMGIQAAGPNSSSGLCNAIMMGKRRAAFSTLWLSHYDYFRSRGRDDLWDYHSVKLPVQLMAANPELLHVLDYRMLFYPLWNSIQRALFSDAGEQFSADFEPAYCFHLWNGATESWLRKIDDAFILTSKSVYAGIARDVEGIGALSAAVKPSVPTAKPPASQKPANQPTQPVRTKAAAL